MGRRMTLRGRWRFPTPSRASKKPHHPDSICPETASSPTGWGFSSTRLPPTTTPGCHRQGPLPLSQRLPWPPPASHRFPRAARWTRRSRTLTGARRTAEGNGPGTAGERWSRGRATGKHTRSLSRVALGKWGRLQFPPSRPSELSPASKARLWASNAAARGFDSCCTPTDAPVLPFTHSQTAEPTNTRTEL